jgi:hypothetical protein
MLDEARAALQSALQAAEAAAATASSSSSSGSNGSSSGASTSSSLHATAAADGALGIGIDSVTLGDSSRPGQLQLQEQPSSDDSILSDMSTSSGSNDGSSIGQAGAVGAVQLPAGSTQQAATAVAAAVPLASVKEALAVVLTDLGTRAKNAGVC